MRGRASGMLKKGVTVSLITSFVVCSGCVAYKFASDDFPMRERERRQAIFKNLVLGVESTDKSHTYELEKFIVALKKTGLFKDVAYRDRLSRSDLILTSFSQTGTNPYEACLLGPAGQILMIGTGGIIPQVCNAEYLVSFVLYAPSKKAQQTKRVSVKYETHSIVGWVALFYIPSADWSAQPSEERYPELLKAVFARESAAIQELLP